MHNSEAETDNNKAGAKTAALVQVGLLAGLAVTCLAATAVKILNEEKDDKPPSTHIRDVRIQRINGKPQHVPSPGYY